MVNGKGTGLHPASNKQRRRLLRKQRNGNNAKRSKDERILSVKQRLLLQKQLKLSASVGIVKRSRGKKKIGVDARSKKKNEDVHHVHLDRKFSIIPFIDRFLIGWCAD